MQKHTKATSRVVSLLLAVVMLVGLVPTTAFAFDDPISGSTGTGWDNFGGEYIDFNTGDIIPDNNGNDSGSSPTYDGEDDDDNEFVFIGGQNGSASKPNGNDNINADDLDSVDDSQQANAAAATATKTDVALGASGDGWLMPDDVAEDFLAFIKAVEAYMNRPMVFAAPGDSATVTWGWGAFVNFTTSVGHFVTQIPVLTVSTSDPSVGNPFCAEFGIDPNTSSSYTASAGTNQTILRLLIAHHEGKASEVGTQMAIWSITNHATFAEHSGANAALAAAQSVNTSGYSYLHWSAGSGQDFVTLEEFEDLNQYRLTIIKQNEDGSAVISNAEFSVTGPNGFIRTELKTDSKGEILVPIPAIGIYTVTETTPPPGYLPADPASKTVEFIIKGSGERQVIFNNKLDENGPPPPGDDGSETTIETGEETETTQHSETTYEYSDAIGQIMIRKHDHHGNSLDDALFDIRVDFTSGAPIIVQNWEVDNGARLFTWTHPKDNHDPAIVTVTEVQAPLHYDLDPTPKTAVVNPTYTRVTHVTSWSETTTTTTTNVTVIKDGEVIDESSSTATASVKSEPQVQEYADFVVGDRETTVTFRNQRQTGDIIVTKRDANTGVPLANAHVHLQGRDLGDPSNIDMVLITDENGEARFEFLPPGTYTIQETQAPFGYNLNDEIQTVVLQSNEIVRREIRNYKKDGLFIKKVDENGAPLPGAVFELRRGSGEVLLREVTDANGLIYRGFLVDDTYVIEEIKAPEGYLLDENPIQSIRIYATDDNKEYTVTFVNRKKPAIEITKVDGLDTGVKLPGAVFRVTDTRTNHYWDIETGADGKVLLESLEINTTYMVEEIKAPAGYINSGYRQEIVLRECRTHTITVENFENPGIQLIKKDKATGALLPGSTFRISWNGGADFRDVTTNKDGIALVTGLNEGWYTIVETNAPEGYLLDATPQQILLEGGKTTVVEIFNEAKPSLKIFKVDEVTKTPLPHAKFRIEQKTDTGDKLIGNYVSDANGVIFLDNIQPGRYLITEVQAPDGYNIDTTTYEVTIEYGQAYELEFTNTPQSPIYIQKVDDRGNPLPGAKFKVTTMNGAMVAQVTTGLTGYAIIPYVQPGWYIVEEIQAPDGYILNNTPVNIEVKSGRPAQVEFVNIAKPGLRILKLDADTQNPLGGSKFKIVKASGELVGEYTTDINGLIHITDLAPGAYVITELRAPDGYILDVTPYTVNLEAGKTVGIEVYNTSKPGLQLLKKDVFTSLPVGGARFNVTFLQNGAKKELGSYTTSENGTFFIPDLTPGYYIITETKAADGYILDSTPREIYVEGGKLNTIEVYNTPYSDLRLLKIDSEDRAPLANAVFKLFDERRLEIGTYTTTELGEIYVSGLPSGTYFIQEVRAPAGYVLDNTVRQVELIGGKTTTIEVKNTALGTLRVLKVDSKTNKPLYNATFLLYDNRDNLLGEFTTNQNGLIIFGASLQAGTYKLKEIKAPDGYVLDDKVHSIVVKAGSTVEYTVKNDLKVGNIQILKVAESKNSITGDKAGAGLRGAEFEIFDTNLKLVDKIRTDSNGIATSKDLPLGRYVIKEVKAPQYYFTDGKPMYAEIKVHGDLIRFKVENTPEIIEVTVEKRGVVETMEGEVIRYNFANIANQSNCELDNFYWRDELPTNAVRIQSLNTGTWNERGTYEVWVRTNLKGWKRIKSNLHTNVEYTIHMTPNALGLASNEYVTEYKLEFGTVEEGFTSIKDPFIEVKVNQGLSQGFRFVNNTDVGGQRGKEWVYARDSWITVIYKVSTPNRKLPKTGGADFFEVYPEYLDFIQE